MPVVLASDDPQGLERVAYYFLLAFAAPDHEREPQDTGDGEQRLGGEDGEGQRGREGEEKVVGHAFEALRIVRRQDEGHQTTAVIARSAAERTSSGLNVVRHRKSPGSQTR